MRCASIQLLEFFAGNLTRRNLPPAVSQERDMQAPTESRLDELEAKLSLAEDLIDELNHTVFRQQERLDRMQQQILLLHQQIQSVQPNEERDLRDELPPHY